MLAVGRMHLDAGLLAEAQASLVAAGKANGRDSKPFRYLGEVLLRRGDAVRAERCWLALYNSAPMTLKLGFARTVLSCTARCRNGLASRQSLRRFYGRCRSKIRFRRRRWQASATKALATKSRRSPALRIPFPTLRVQLKTRLPRFESEDPVRVSDADLLEESAPRLSARASVARATTLGIGPPGPKLPPGPASEGACRRGARPIR